MFHWLLRHFGPLRRSSGKQQEVDAETQNLILYHLPLCGYCLHVRQTLWRLNLNVELRNTQDPQWGQELRREGGRSQVPCLRIDHPDRAEWMYESADIIRFLKRSYGR